MLFGIRWMQPPRQQEHVRCRCGTDRSRYGNRPLNRASQINSGSGMVSAAPAIRTEVLVERQNPWFVVDLGPESVLQGKRVVVAGLVLLPHRKMGVDERTEIGP